VVQGQDVAAFEEEFAAAVGASGAVACFKKNLFGQPH